MESGVVHESMNFAATAKLPILFVCENNFYSVYSPLNVRQPNGRSLSEIAKAHCLNTVIVDGNSVADIHHASCNIVDDLRKGSMPFFLELPTYRWREHCGPGYDNNIGYRSEEEFESWKAKDPLTYPNKYISDLCLKSFRDDIQREINEAFLFAENASFAPVSSASEHIFDSPNSPTENLNSSSDRVLTFAEALRESQDHALETDNSVYLMGLGVPDPKGIFGTTLDLQREHGKDRVIFHCQRIITGVIGSAITGTRPISHTNVLILLWFH